MMFYFYIRVIISNLFFACRRWCCIGIVFSWFANLNIVNPTEYITIYVIISLSSRQKIVIQETFRSTPCFFISWKLSEHLLVTSSLNSFKLAWFAVARTSKQQWKFCHLHAIVCTKMWSNYSHTCLVTAVALKSIRLLVFSYSCYSG